MRDVRQGLGIVLSRHAPHQRSVARHHTHREHFVGSSLMFALFGSSVLEPHLLRQDDRD